MATRPRPAKAMVEFGLALDSVRTIYATIPVGHTASEIVSSRRRPILTSHQVEDDGMTRTSGKSPDKATSENATGFKNDCRALPVTNISANFYDRKSTTTDDPLQDLAGLRHYETEAVEVGQYLEQLVALEGLDRIGQLAAFAQAGPDWPALGAAPRDPWRCLGGPSHAPWLVPDGDRSTSSPAHTHGRPGKSAPRRMAGRRSACRLAGRRS